MLLRSLVVFLWVFGSNKHLLNAIEMSFCIAACRKELEQPIEPFADPLGRVDHRYFDRIVKSHGKQKRQHGGNDQSIERSGCVVQTETLVLADDGEGHLMEQVNAKRVLAHVSREVGFGQPTGQEIRCTHEHDEQEDTPVVSQTEKVLQAIAVRQSNAYDEEEKAQKREQALGVRQALDFGRHVEVLAAFEEVGDERTEVEDTEVEEDAGKAPRVAPLCVHVVHVDDENDVEGSDGQRVPRALAMFKAYVWAKLRRLQNANEHYDAVKASGWAHVEKVLVRVVEDELQGGVDEAESDDGCIDAKEAHDEEVQCDLCELEDIVVGCFVLNDHPIGEQK